MSTALEIENKYVVDQLISWIDIAELFKYVTDIKRISQTYLKPTEKGEPSVRMRKTISGFGNNLTTEFHYNKKTFVSSGINSESEEKITEDHYNKCLKHKDPKLVEIEKTRIVFEYKNQIFELDLFKGLLKGLAILEIELKNKNDKVNLPPFLKIRKNVTKNKNYSNYSLANKKLHKNLK